MQPFPLRAMRISDLLDLAFRLYRRHFVRLISIAAVALVPLTVLHLLALSILPTGRLIDTLQNLFITTLIGGTLTVAGLCALRAEALSLRHAYQRSFKRYWSLLGAIFLQSLIVGLPAALLAGVLAVVLLASGVSSPVLIFILIVVLVPVIGFLSTKYAITFPVILNEAVGASNGMSRSWQLTTGMFWHVAGVMLATTMLTALIAQVLPLTLTYLIGVMGYEATTPWVQVAQLFLTQLGLLISLPFQYLAPVVLYYDLRVRKEGYDLEQASQMHLAADSLASA